MKILTRGLTGSASQAILAGLGPNPITDAVRGAVRRGRRAKQQLGELLEELKVSVALIAFNGKDLVNPIINAMRTSYKDEPAPRIEVTPTRLAVKQPDIKINVTNVRSKYVDN